MHVGLYHEKFSICVCTFYEIAVKMAIEYNDIDTF